MKIKLWNRYSSAKQSRLSTNNEEEKIICQSPVRKRNLVAKPEQVSCFIPYSQSFFLNSNNCIIDSSLLNSRRFLVSWKSNPTGFTRLELNSKSGLMNLVKLESPISTSFLLDEKNEATAKKIETLRVNCEKYLEIELELSEFTKEGPVPMLKPRSGNQLIRRFFECTEQLRNKIGYF